MRPEILDETSTTRYRYQSASVSTPKPHYRQTAYSCSYGEGTWEDHSAYGSGVKTSGRWLAGPAKSTVSGIIGRYDLYYRAQRRCYESAFNGQSAQIGAAIAEIGDSFDMIYYRVKSIYEAYKALRKGRLRRMWDLLAVPDDRRRRYARSLKKHPPSLWLEYWFGWAPLVSDMYTAHDIITSGEPFSKAKVRGTASARSVYHYEANNPSWEYHVVKRDIRVTCAYTGYIESMDKTKVSLHALGMNPAEIAWEVVPFSFVVDWFSNFGQWLTCWTNDYGLELGNAAMATWAKGQYETREQQWGSFGGYSNSHTNRAFWREPTNAVFYPRLQVYPLRAMLDWKLTRAATATSLATLLFTKDR